MERDSRQRRKPPLQRPCGQMECGVVEAPKIASVNSKEESDTIQGRRVELRPTKLGFVGYFKELCLLQEWSARLLKGWGGA